MRLICDKKLSIQEIYIVETPVVRWLVGGWVVVVVGDIQGISSYWPSATTDRHLYMMTRRIGMMVDMVVCSFDRFGQTVVMGGEDPTSRGGGGGQKLQPNE